MTSPNDDVTVIRSEERLLASSTAVPVSVLAPGVAISSTNLLRRRCRSPSESECSASVLPNTAPLSTFPAITGDGCALPSVGESGVCRPGAVGGREEESLLAARLYGS